MKKKKIYLYLFFTLNFYVTSFAQYLGGTDDGHSVGVLTASSCPVIINENLYFGGADDGHSVGVLSATSCPVVINENVYFGGDDDGHSVGILSTTVCPAILNENLFLGGTDDGHSLGILSTTVCPPPFNENLFLGGNDDGHALGILTVTVCPSTNNDNIAFGGMHDGADNQAFIQGVCLPLPIELVAFEANCDEKMNSVLSWTTVSESNNDYFNLQQSTDALTWKTIVKVNGAGNSTSTTRYSYSYILDTDTAIIYYRLKQIDYDGSYELSGIISLENCKSKTTERTIYAANPFKDYISVKNVTGNETYELLNSNGQRVFYGKNIQSENLNYLSSSIYILIVTDDINNKTKQFKLIKE